MTFPQQDINCKGNANSTPHIGNYPCRPGDLANQDHRSLFYLWRLPIKCVMTGPGKYTGCHGYTFIITVPAHSGLVALKDELAPTIINGEFIFNDISKQQRPELIISGATRSKGIGNIKTFHTIFLCYHDGILANTSIIIGDLEPVCSRFGDRDSGSSTSIAP